MSRTISYGVLQSVADIFAKKITQMKDYRTEREIAKYE
jgi:hypothetical protein